MNRALLEYTMKCAGIKAEQLAEKLGIDRSTFYKKCSGASEFRQSEIMTIIEILHIENPMPIFFEDKVS